MTRPGAPIAERPERTRVARARELLLSEWTKLRSVRSTLWALLVAAVTAIAGSVIIAFSSATGKRPPFDPVAGTFVAWLEYPVLAVGILGALVVTSEYATGQIRTTFAAVPHRGTVLAAKAAVLGGLILALSELLAFASFAVTDVILSAHRRGVRITQPHVLGAVAAAGLAMLAIALVGVGLGAIFRHTAAAVAALPALLYLPLAVLSLPSPWNHTIGRYTLLAAAYQLVSQHPRPYLLTPPLSLLILLAWPAATLLAGAVLMQRRDA